VSLIRSLCFVGNTQLVRPGLKHRWSRRQLRRLGSAFVSRTEARICRLVTRLLITLSSASNVLTVLLPTWISLAALALLVLPLSSLFRDAVLCSCLRHSLEPQELRHLVKDTRKSWHCRLIPANSGHKHQCRAALCTREHRCLNEVSSALY
jgi:hypothetical protein